MKKSFAARRGTPRKIASEDEDAQTSSVADGSKASASPVRRPALGAKPKKSSSLRMSFGVTEIGDDDSAVFTPKKSGLSRLASERYSEREGKDEAAPSYSKDYLAELKSATPSRPTDVSGVTTDLDGDLDTGLDRITQAGSIDIAAKFGAEVLARPTSTAIPSEAEIREKKERRARLAKEGEYLSLNSDDEEVDQDGRLVLREKPKYAETRLERDDEDFAEGFDEFTEYSNNALGRNAEREAARRRQREMAEMIAQAEGSSEDDETDDSDAERNAAYESAQTMAGTYSERNTGYVPRQDEERQKTPPRMTPIPELSDIIVKLQTSLVAMQEAKTARMMRLDQLAAEKLELEQRGIWIQSQLKEVGDKYEALRQETGFAAVTGDIEMNGVNGRQNGKLYIDRGLESLGTASNGHAGAGSVMDEEFRPT